MVNIASWEITCNDDPFQSISFSIYCAGCNKNCRGCHSPNLQNPLAGVPTTTTRIMQAIDSRRSLIESIVFLGGEWMLYPEDLRTVAMRSQVEHDLKTILYTGEYFEFISSDILEYLDIIIDGIYIEELKTNYKVPASYNQRIFIKQYQDDLFKSGPTSEFTHVPINPALLPINREI